MIRFSMSWLAIAVVGCEGTADRDASVDATGWHEPPPFPADFLWGAATAPYQIEGGLHATDWYRWERLGEVSGCDSAEDGPDSWERWSEDLAALEAMGLGAYRFGIEWARLYPTRESWEADAPDAEAVARYHQMLGAMVERDIVPMVTLQHFALPIWISDPCDLDARPGWLDPGVPDLFGEWARRAAVEFGDEVDLWISINEPMVYALAANFLGGFPPGARHSTILEPERAFEDVTVTVAHMLHAHALAFDAIHDVDGTALVSVATHNRVFEAAHAEDAAEVAAADALQYGLNRLFLDALTSGDLDLNIDGDHDDPGEGVALADLRDRLDFIGLNYYSRTLVSVLDGFPLPGFPLFEPYDTPEPKSDLQWDILPDGLRVVLDEVGRYELPVYITENGVADSGDVLRATFLVDHLDVLARAIGDGADVRGYFHWSLVDNFEWVRGFCPRFGLYTLGPGGERRETEGARVYRDIVAAGRVTAALRERYRDYGAPSTCVDRPCETPAEECEAP